jgi:ribosomal protein S18 acetylase RimI-like enzyme
MSTAIADLERIASLHWHPADRARLGEWELRAAAGFTGRANSALPLGTPGTSLDLAVRSVAAWYRERGLPPMITIPAPLAGPAGELDDFLAGLGWTMRPGAAYVMTARAGTLPAPPMAAHIDASPDAAWLSLFRDGQAPSAGLSLLQSAPWQAFGSFRSGAEIRAVGRVSVAGGWGAITALEVAPAWRRRGLGAALTSALCAAAEADRVLLQVAIDNAPAIALYQHLGFRISHRYHCRIAPST